MARSRLVAFRKLLLCLALWREGALAARLSDHKLDLASEGGDFSSGALPVIHILGDTHGDENYMVRGLLSTGRFELGARRRRAGSLRWRRDLRQGDNFEIVILGDVIDRGTLSHECLLTLKSLTEEKPWGDSLKVLLGNHEGMMLRWSMKYGRLDAKTGGWGDAERETAHAAADGTVNYDLFEWLVDLPVMRFSNGVLMMHGGLSLPVFEYYRNRAPQCERNGTACGSQIVKFFNSRANTYFRQIRACVQEGNKTGYECAAGIKRRRFLSSTKGAGGVLWYRGYSAKKYGAGGSAACADAAAVGAAMGSDVFAVAHSTHEAITQYCSDSAVRVYATDTHYTDCVENDECDFSLRHAFHEGSIDTNATNVPQTLEVRTSEDRDGIVTRQVRTCFSKVATTSEDYKSSRVEVECIQTKASLTHPSESGRRRRRRKEFGM